MKDLATALRRDLARPIDPAGLTAFRVLYGLLGAFGAVRFLALGWVERFFGEPTFFFRYFGLEWVPVPPLPLTYALYVIMALSGLGIALGYRYRLSVGLHLLAFLWVELIDVTNYLNHYHLWTLLGLLLLALPLHAHASLDARAGRIPARETFPQAWARAFQLQVGLVYVFAGLAKLHPDWLVHGQPLGIWLASREDTPLIGDLLGDLLAHPRTALLMSWLGFLHDLLVPFLLLWRKTRALAFLALCAFHLATHLLFDIGLFPLIMTLGATTFLAPTWPRALAQSLGIKRREGRDILHPRPSLEDQGKTEPTLKRNERDRPRPEENLENQDNPPLDKKLENRDIRPRLAALWFGLQLLLPLRAHAYGGDVLWHEQGMRWSWRVMVREKNGSILYRVRLPDRAGELHVPPSRYLTAHQEREMSGQPDLILQLAHAIAADFRARGHVGVEVRVDALVSLNGRPAARLIDPDVDLARVSDGLSRATWILTEPATPPARLARPPEPPSRTP